MKIKDYRTKFLFLLKELHLEALRMDICVFAILRFVCLDVLNLFLQIECIIVPELRVR